MDKAEHPWAESQASQQVSNNRILLQPLRSQTRDEGDGEKGNEFDEDLPKHLHGTRIAWEVRCDGPGQMKTGPAQSVTGKAEPVYSRKAA